jgi:hypothetical protein
MIYSLLKLHPMDGVVFIGYVIGTLRAEAPLHAASTPSLDAVLAAGYDKAVVTSNEARGCIPRLGPPPTLEEVSSGRCGIPAILVPSIRTEIARKAP